MARPWGLHVLELRDGRVAGLHVFLDPVNLFAAFGLPAHLDGTSGPGPGRPGQPG